jgi:hypothetical protein
MWVIVTSAAKRGGKERLSGSTNIRGLSVQVDYKKALSIVPTT